MQSVGGLIIRRAKTQRGESDGGGVEGEDKLEQRGEGGENKQNTFSAEERLK